MTSQVVNMESIQGQRLVSGYESVVLINWISKQIDTTSEFS